MKALLIIDMQLGSFSPYSLRQNTEAVISRINLLSEHFRTQGHKVIFISHDGTRENSFIPGSSEWEILPELIRGDKDAFISKTANDSFYKSHLEGFLKQQGISELYVTGCASDYCVDATVKSALSKDYKITIVSDGHTTADRPMLKAKQLIEFYNWLWADLTPTKYKIEVRTAKEIVG